MDGNIVTVIVRGTVIVTISIIVTIRISTGDKNSDSHGNGKSKLWMKSPQPPHLRTPFCAPGSIGGRPTNTCAPQLRTVHAKLKEEQDTRRTLESQVESANHQEMLDTQDVVRMEALLAQAQEKLATAEEVRALWWR